MAALRDYGDVVDFLHFSAVTIPSAKRRVKTGGLRGHRVRVWTAFSGILARGRAVAGPDDRLIERPARSSFLGVNLFEQPRHVLSKIFHGPDALDILSHLAGIAAYAHIPVG